VVFRRREKRTTAERLQALVYPKGGWVRAARYVRHRLTRLPDPPHRIARGIWAGVLISFTPLFGFHFLGAGLLAYLMRGNVVAAILGTFFGNPVTFPLIAVGSVQLGHWMLGTGVDGVPASQILSAFGQAGREVWSNLFAYMTGGDAEWGKLSHFYNGLFKPYLIGGIMPGIISATVCYYLSLPVISAYQKLRQKRRSDRSDKRREGAALRFRPKRAGASTPERDLGGGGAGSE
jgi:uncharacterized protein (DUF2062 family)